MIEKSLAPVMSIGYCYLLGCEDIDFVLIGAAPSEVPPVEALWQFGLRGERGAYYTARYVETDTEGGPKPEI